MKNRNGLSNTKAIKSSVYGNLYPTKNGYEYFSVINRPLDLTWMPTLMKADNDN